MAIDEGKTIDAVAGIVKAIGDTAVAAMQVGAVVVPILEDIGLLFPPAAVAANYVNVAMPYITEVAKYAPAVSTGLEQNKTLIEAAVGVGSALTSPLSSLIAAIPELVIVHEFFTGLNNVLVASEFSPQDPRFDRESGNQ